MASDITTNGVRIEVKSFYIDEYSDSAKGSWLFSYRIRITNLLPRRVKLLRRHWIIIDSEGKRDEVTGDGVVGAQPELEQNQFHEYLSFCRLDTDFGTMEGSFTFSSDGASEFDAQIGRFFLAANLWEFEGNRFRRGQIIENSRLAYRGVVVDFDMYYMREENWYASFEIRPARLEPWYHILVDATDTVTYAPQEHLRLAAEPSEIIHPLTAFFFDAFDSGQYLRNLRTWEELKNL